MKLKHLLFTLIVQIYFLKGFAYDAKIDGIYYNFSGTNASVTFQIYELQNSYPHSDYSGSVVIPASVTYRSRTYRVTSIGYNAFYGCSSLTSVTIPNSVTSIGWDAFRDCSSLTSITIGNSVTDIGDYAFRDCSSLTSITIGNSVTDIGDYAFKGCSGLTSVTIGNSVTSIGDYAFRDCSDLTSIIIPNSVRRIGIDVFSGCHFANNNFINNSTLTSSTNWGATLYDEETSDGLLISSNTVLKCRAWATSVTIPNGVTSIGEKVFYCHRGLTSVTIPNSVPSIGSNTFYGCSSLTSVTIGNSVTSIGYYAFYGCSSLTSVTIPNSVTCIENNTFQNCSSLSSITIPESVTSIGGDAFVGCSGLTSITIPESVTNIENGAFYYCNNLTSVELNSNAIASATTYSYNNNLGNKFGRQVKEYIFGDNISTIGGAAFYDCNGLTSITIGNNVSSIGGSAFSGCYCLKSINIPNSVTSIGGYAFKGCSGLTSVTIPNSVTCIENNTFQNCSSLTSITIPESVTSIGKDAFSGCNNLTSVELNSNTIASATYSYNNNLGTIFGRQVKEYIIGDNISTIGADAFVGCSGLTAITIPNSVTSIGSGAFYGCSSLSSITIPESVTNIDGAAFRDCSGLRSIIIPNSVTSIGTRAFCGCSLLKSITIPNSVTSIGLGAFQDCVSLTDIALPESVTIIENVTFSGCYRLSSVEMSKNIKLIGNDAFKGCTNINFYVDKGTDGLLSVWNYGVDPYEKGTTQLLLHPSVSVVSTTQTSIKYQINNFYPELEYQYDNNSSPLGNNEYLITGLRPKLSQPINLVVKSANNSYSTNYNAQTSPISPTLACEDVTASSLSVKGSYTKGDAKVVSCTLIMNGKEMGPEEGTLYGLDPNKSYSCKYSVVVEYGNGESYTYNGNESFYTSRLNFVTQQPRVISAGNVIVAADTNLNEEESNVGFEWRRTDWTDDFESKSGGAYQYGGRMEGYIRNLNTDKLWKYRAYYESDTGKRFYGEWKGIDPTDTSYFDPTVYTYARFSVKDNTAEVKGYAMRGTEDVRKQGFMYWKKGSSSTRGNAKSVPANAMVVEAKGNVMIATIENLDYDTEYCYVAFATTTNNETFYGEEQTFKTGTASQDVIDGIEGTEDADGVTEIARYDLNGRKLSIPQKGINIIRFADGTSKKVLIK